MPPNFSWQKPLVTCGSREVCSRVWRKMFGTDQSTRLADRHRHGTGCLLLTAWLTVKLCEFECVGSKPDGRSRTHGAAQVEIISVEQMDAQFSFLKTNDWKLAEDFIETHLMKKFVCRSIHGRTKYFIISWFNSWLIFSRQYFLIETSTLGNWRPIVFNVLRWIKVCQLKQLYLCFYV